MEEKFPLFIILLTPMYNSAHRDLLGMATLYGPEPVNKEEIGICSGLVQVQVPLTTMNIIMSMIPMNGKLMLNMTLMPTP